VPGRASEPTSGGTNSLIRQGAILVEEPAHVLEALGVSVEVIRPSPKPAPQPELTGDAKSIWESLSLEPVHVDKIAAESGLGYDAVLAALLKMELDGAVESLSGARYVRSSA